MAKNKEVKKEKIIIANWKMKLSMKDTGILLKKIKTKFATFKSGEIVVCPNVLSLDEAGKNLRRSSVKLGAQNVFWEELGSFTGEVSPKMLKEAGCSYIIIGHSERRKSLNENYEMINKKLRATLNAGSLVPIICIGENWDERKTERRDFVLMEQMQMALAGIEIIGDEQIIIAYEPIWAIGSGMAMEPEEADYAHKIIKLTLNEMYGSAIAAKNFRVIYGGSISSKNVKEFAVLENIDGLLVGGASLDAEEFFKIAKIVLK